MNIMKIIGIHARITKQHENSRNPFDNSETHENLRNPNDNLKKKTN